MQLIPEQARAQQAGAEQAGGMVVTEGGVILPSGAVSGPQPGEEKEHVKHSEKAEQRLEEAARKAAGGDTQPQRDQGEAVQNAGEDGAVAAGAASVPGAPAATAGVRNKP